MVVIVCCFEFDEHEVDCADGWGKKEDLHGGVVDGNKTGEKVQVTSQKNNGEQDLRPTWKKVKRQLGINLIFAPKQE